MPNRAGPLIFQVALEKLVSGSDGAGGTWSGWEEQFRCRAGYTHLKGGEEVMAGRLSGHHTQIIRIRASVAAQAVTTDWRVRDVRDDMLFNIRDVTPGQDRAFIDLLCQKGVAT